MLLGILISFLWPLFLILPPAVYAFCKIKYKNETLPEGYAVFERRAAAYILDYILYIGISYTTNKVYSILSVPIILPPLAIIWLLSALNIIVLPSIKGWSIGKRIVSIKIVKKDFKKASLVDIIYREIVKNWFSVPIFLLGCLWMLFGKNKLTWHDSVADTRIIYLVKEANNANSVDA